MGACPASTPNPHKAAFVPPGAGPPLAWTGLLSATRGGAVQAHRLQATDPRLTDLEKERGSPAMASRRGWGPIALVIPIGGCSLVGRQAWPSLVVQTRGCGGALWARPLPLWFQPLCCCGIVLVTVSTGIVPDAARRGGSGQENPGIAAP